MVEGQRIGRVLVVDDDEDLRLGIAASLEAESIPHVTVASGEAALEELKAGPFDLVFADIGLPGMTGLELCAWIREELPETPVVVITAMNELDTAVAALRAGAEDFVAKPFDFQLVTLRARRALSVKRTEREPARLRAPLAGAEGDAGLHGASPVLGRGDGLVGREADTMAAV